MIQTEHITKSFGRTRILSGISLHVRDRELVAYLGPNGAGKTTTVRILSGQARQTAAPSNLPGVTSPNTRWKPRHCAAS